MIIYISNEENKGILDRLAEQYEWDMLSEVMNRGSLENFIHNKLQVIPNLQYMVIDRSCISESDQDLNEVIETMKVMWSTKVILLMENEMEDDNGEDQKVLYGDDITFLYKYQDNLVGKLEYLLKGERIPAEYTYSGIWIGVMSANSGAGATDISIGMANFIGQYTQSVCYVEANESGDLAAMAEFYGLEKIEENYYRKDGVDYRHQHIDQEKKYIVIDLGKYTATKLSLFEKCTVKILITDGKPYRMVDALNVLKHIGKEDTRLWLNFCQQEEYSRLKERYLSELNIPCGRISRHKDMFHGTDPLYQEVLKNYLNLHSRKQVGFSFILAPDKKKGIWKTASKPKSKQPDNIKDSLQETIPEVPEDNFIEELQAEVPEDDFMDKLQAEVPEDDFMDKLQLELPEDDFTEVWQEELQDTSEEIFAEDYPRSEEEDSPSGKHIRKRPVKNLILLLAIGIGALGVFSLLPQIKQSIDGLSFNNPDTEQVTELVDEELNINSDIKISVLEVEGADGYEVSYSTDKSFDEKTTVVVEVETADKAVESLTAGRTYYVRVRAYRFNEDGVKVYGEYTEVQEIET